MRAGETLRDGVTGRPRVRILRCRVPERRIEEGVGRGLRDFGVGGVTWISLYCSGTQSPGWYGGGSGCGCIFSCSLPLSRQRRYTVRPTAVPIRAALNAVDTIEPARVRRRLAGGNSVNISSTNSCSGASCPIFLYLAGVSR